MSFFWMYSRLQKYYDYLEKLHNEWIFLYLVSNLCKIFSWFQCHLRIFSIFVRLHENLIYLLSKLCIHKFLYINGFSWAWCQSCVKFSPDSIAAIGFRISLFVFKKSGFLWKESRYSKFYGKNGKKRSIEVGIDYFHGKTDSPYGKIDIQFWNNK